MWQPSHLSLYDHQSNVVKWMKNVESKNVEGSKGGVLFLSMGLGKTVTSLEYLRRSGRRQALIVCSKILVTEWVNQIEKFYGENGPTVFVFHNDFNEVKNVTDLTQYDIVITTYNAVLSSNKVSSGQKFSDSLIVKHDEGFVKKWTIKEQRKRRSTLIGVKGKNLLHTTKWDDLIIDECQNITNWTTSSFQSCYALNSVHTFCLSGTPIKNNKAEFIAILRLVGVSRFSVPSLWKSKDDEIVNEFYDLFKVVGYEDTDIVLPDVKEKIIFSKFNEETKKINNHYLDLWTEYSKKGTKKMSMLMGLFTRFRQLSLDPSLVTDVSEDLSSEKFMELIDIIMEIHNRNEKVILFSSFTSFLTKFYSMFEPIITFITSSDSMATRHEKINTWKTAERQPVLMMNYRIGCEGLNLVEANNVILLDSWWNNVYSDQAIARCRRIGQTKEVNVYRLMYEGSIETVMYKKSINKTNIINQLQKGTYYQNVDKHKLTFAVMNSLVNGLKEETL
jgi:SNF2 family DNA or RNA helicase